MLERQTLIEQIRRGLAVYQDYVRPGGTLNLTDTNVHAEDFVAGLLNSIHSWSLVSTNQTTANYPCIDLLDKSLGLGVQVTSEEGSAKLTKIVTAQGKWFKMQSFSVPKHLTSVPRSPAHRWFLQCPNDSS